MAIPTASAERKVGQNTFTYYFLVQEAFRKMLYDVLQYRVPHKVSVLGANKKPFLISA
jgi:hypothetical protein